MQTVAFFSSTVLNHTPLVPSLLFCFSGVDFPAFGRRHVSYSRGFCVFLFCFRPPSFEVLSTGGCHRKFLPSFPEPRASVNESPLSFQVLKSLPSSCGSKLFYLGWANLPFLSPEGIQSPFSRAFCRDLLPPCVVTLRSVLFFPYPRDVVFSLDKTALFSTL